MTGFRLRVQGSGHLRVQGFGSKRLYCGWLWVPKTSMIGALDPLGK